MILMALVGLLTPVIASVALSEETLSAAIATERELRPKQRDNIIDRIVRASTSVVEGSDTSKLLRLLLLHPAAQSFRVAPPLPALSPIATSITMKVKEKRIRKKKDRNSMDFRKYEQMERDNSPGAARRANQIAARYLDDLNDLMEEANFPSKYVTFDLQMRIGIVDVILTKDTRHAKVIVSVDGDRKEKIVAMQWLQGHARSFRHLLAQRNRRMRVIPQLRFIDVDFGAQADLLSRIEELEYDDFLLEEKERKFGSLLKGGAKDEDEDENIWDDGDDEDDDDDDTDDEDDDEDDDLDIDFDKLDISDLGELDGLSDDEVFEKYMKSKLKR